MALRNDGGPPEDYPESGYFEEKPSQPSLRSAVLLGAGLAGGALARGLMRKAMR